MADYDFITTCNWTATGNYTLEAFRGSSTNVVTSYSLYYRKKGTSEWTETTNGVISITSTGEWEVANDWNISGDDVLTHSYDDISAINSCTDVYFNEVSLGDSVGDFFLINCWNGCTNLASMPEGFNLPSGLTSVGNYFLINCWNGCTNLASMPEGFNLPSGLTSVGNSFLVNCWRGCTDLASMPRGFNLPSGLTSVGSSFLQYCWYNCTSLDNDGDYTEAITFEFSASGVFSGSCPIEPDSVTASKEDPVDVEVNRPQPPPSAPTLNSATAGNQKVSLSWSSTADTTGYKVKYGTATGTYGTTTDVSNVTSYDVTGLTNGTEYFFVVVAYNAVGDSDDSNELSATPTAPPAPAAAPAARFGGYMDYEREKKQTILTPQKAEPFAPPEMKAIKKWENDLKNLEKKW